MPDKENYHYFVPPHIEQELAVVNLRLVVTRESKPDLFVFVDLSEAYDDKGNPIPIHWLLTMVHTACNEVEKVAVKNFGYDPDTMEPPAKENDDKG